MKLVFLILAACGLVLYLFSEYIEWVDSTTLLIISMLFFFLGIIYDYNRRGKQKDILDDDYLDDV